MRRGYGKGGRGRVNHSCVCVKLQQQVHTCVSPASVLDVPALQQVIRGRLDGRDVLLCGGGGGRVHTFSVKGTSGCTPVGDERDCSQGMCDVNCVNFRASGSQGIVFSHFLPGWPVWAGPLGC